MLLVGEALAVAANKLGGDRDRVLARIGGGIGVAARTTAARIAALPPAEQKLQRARISALARAPLPPGIRGVHPTWIEAALATLPPRARASVSGDVASGRVDAWLARWATAELVPMPELRSERPRGFGDLAALPHDLLAAWLANAGADQLARAAQIANAAHADLRAAPALAAALARISIQPRAGHLGPDAAVVARCRGIAIAEPGALVRIAARAIAPHFATDAVGRRQLALRLPRELGLAVERELRDHAHVPLDHCPTWTALSAG